MIQLENVGDIIHLSIAPAFLLVGVGTQLRVLTNRLARIINRCRFLESRLIDAGAASQQTTRTELDFLYRRMDLIHHAIRLNTCCALLICVVIVVLFVDDVFDVGMAQPIAILFIVSMLSLIAGFVCFLREIFIATKTLSLFMRRSSEPK
jgi:hypothetical protein